MKLIIKHKFGQFIFSGFKYQVSGFFFLVLLFFYSGQCVAAEALLKKVVIKENPESVRLYVTQKIPSKVIRVDSREVLIALKNISARRGIEIKGRPGGLIKNIAVETLPGGVLALVVTGNRNFKDVKSNWNSSGLTFTIRFEEKKIAKVKQTAPAKASPKSDSRKKDQKSQVFDTEKKISSVKQKAVKDIYTAEKGELAPVKREKSLFAGDTTDLLFVADVSGCKSKEMTSAVRFLKKGLWQNAFDNLNIHVDQNSQACRNQAFFLRAYAYLRLIEKDDHESLLKAAALFNEALIAYPDSRLAPFAFASLGKINAFLKNDAVAEGYFSIVRDEFMEYPGLPEIFYYLGKIYGEKGYAEKSLKYFEKVFKVFPENTYTVDAGIGFGKALYKKRHYIDSLNILSHLIKSNPEKVYDSSELLLSIGNANLKLGKSLAARKNLIRVCNLFPGVEAKDMIMSSIGDTYALEKNFNRAMALYRLVREKFPGGEGFLASSMGLARYLKDIEEKEKLYGMIKQDFPEHRFASVAMMRLAEIYDKAGEYAKCIKEVEDLLATHPRGLRYEAVKLMQRAYESLFDKQLKSDQYPDILQRYEAERVLINRMESKEIFLSVGLAYLKADLYEQSFNQLIKSYKQYKRSKRPPELLLGLGIAMDESRRDDDALKVLKGFTKRFSGNDKTSDAHVRRGEIFFEKDMYKNAIKEFTLAYKAGKDHLQKGKILARKAGVYKKENKWDKSSAQLVLAVKEFAAASGTNYHVLSNGYRELGRSYVKQNMYVKGAEAFTTALKFSGKAENAAELEFAIGDAYQKGNVLKKAKKAFENVIAADDSIWARLAKERLATLVLAQKVKNS
ncbi:MAG: tetratricopeptide repeat protein [Thermodesulfobacteriota bacterium]|nr:tetratricopeptide repeat protein [Thermodesulfobacteriota bacterium]